MVACNKIYSSLEMKLFYSKSLNKSIKLEAYWNMGEFWKILKLVEKFRTSKLKLSITCHKTQKHGTSYFCYNLGSSSSELVLIATKLWNVNLDILLGGTRGSKSKLDLDIVVWCILISSSLSCCCLPFSYLSNAISFELKMFIFFNNITYTRYSSITCLPKKVL